MRIALALILTALLWSCSSKGKQPTPTEGTATSADTTSATVQDSTAVVQDTTPAAPFEGYTWVLYSITENGKTATMVPNSRITLEFKKGNISGNGGCNDYMSTYTSTEDALEIAEIASSKKVCGGLMGQEANYFKLLNKVNAWKIDRVELTLSSPGVVLKFHNNRPEDSKQ